MEIVKLRVQVDNSQLTKLQADVNSLQGTKIIVSTGGLQSTQAEITKTTQGIQQMGTAMAQTSQTWRDGTLVRSIDTVNDGLGKTVKFTTDIGEESVTVTRTVTENFDKQRQAAEKAASAEKRAIDSATAAYEKYIAAQQQSTRNTKIQDRINYATGIDRDYSPKITAQNSMFGKISDEEFRNYTSGVRDATEATGKFSQAAQEAGKSSDTLLGNIQKFSRWYLIGNAVSGITRSMRDALDTMKEVDSQLVVIRKVTGASGDDLKKIEEQAYDTATAFGVVANEYLESVAAFSRAGYGNQSQALAELATKTQIVGDTNAETANQFLLSVDAAYKYKGNVEALSAVLDGANEIDNKYATSIEKIAEGLGTVAPVAAQAHVGVDELTAAIGTITAVTQRSGSEAARAFRALVLNILGDTKTEIDEGVTWTTGEIAGLRDVIKIYAKDAYNAAQATGSLIDPMEAIGGLAQSMKDGLLTEQQLMEMVSDIGGKLRTSQLIALIENWDMYQSMLSDFGNAVGSADREVENALNSWERKTARLSNTWTEFISHLVNTDAIKGGLDVVTGLIKVLDTDFGRAVITGTTLIGVITAGSTAVKGLDTAIKMAAITKAQGAAATAALSAADKEAMLASLGLGESIQFLTKAMLQNPLFWAVAGFAAISLFVKLTEDAGTKTDRAAKKVDDATTKMRDAETEISQINGKIEENNRLIEEANRLGKDDSYVKRLETENERLEVQKKLQEDIAEKEREKTAKEAFSGLTSTLSYNNYGTNEDGQTTISSTKGTLLDRAENLIGYTGTEDVSGQLSDVMEQVLAFRDALDGTDEASAALIDRIDNELIPAYMGSGDAANEAAETAVEAGDAVAESADNMTSRIAAMQELMEAMSDGIDDVQSSLSILSAAQDEYNEYGSISIDTLQQLLTLDAEYLNALFDETGALNLNSDAVAGLLTDKSKMLEALAAEAVANYAAEEAERLLAAQTGETGDVASTASGQIQAAATAAFNSGVDASNAAAGWRDLAAAIQSVYGGKGLNQQNMRVLQNNVQEYANSVRAALSSASYGVGSWSGTAYSGSGRSSSGGSSGSSSNSAERSRLQALKKEKEDEKKRAQKQRDEEIAAVDKQIAELKAQRKEQEKANKLTELQLDVEQAQLDLLNAQSERTVRYYNASTGQWEWIAKNTDVLKAEQALEDARKKLADEKAQQAYEEQLAVLEEQKKGLQDYWKNAINRFDDAINTLQVKLSNLGSGNGGGGGSSSGSGSGGTSYGDYKTGEAVKALQQFLNQSFGGRLTVDGIYGSATKNAVRNMQSEIGVQADGYYSSGTRNALYNYFVANHRPVANIPAAVYDSGGILHGMGGIKATRADEIVLPPSVAKRMLTPAADSVFEKRLSELSYLYSEKNNVPTSVAGNTENRIGSQHNGNVYQFGGVQISEQDAKQMSVYEFARRSRNLGLHSWDK